MGPAADTSMHQPVGHEGHAVPREGDPPRSPCIAHEARSPLQRLTVDEKSRKGPPMEYWTQPGKFYDGPDTLFHD